MVDVCKKLVPQQTMKASELVASIQKLIIEFGDLPVVWQSEISEGTIENVYEVLEYDSKRKLFML